LTSNQSFSIIVGILREYSPPTRDRVYKKNSSWWRSWGQARSYQPRSLRT